MISGCCNFTGQPGVLPVFLSPERGDNGLKYFPLEAEGFAGGYYLHDRLPLTRDDICFLDEAADILVLFSGYIYNKKELATASGGDVSAREPAIAASLFLAEGPDFVRKLNGDFAIFICRPAARKAYLFRDQIGVRPIAWSLLGGQLVFSSDNRVLSRLNAGGKGPETSWLTGYFRYVDFKESPCNNVKKLLPGHYLEYTGEGIRTTRYWDPEKIRTNRRMDYDAMISDLKQLVSDAVAIRCDSRFNAGSHVSSGIDSGLVASLARAEYSSQQLFYGYSWSPAEFTAGEIPYDERDLVRSLCNRAGITPVYSGITPDEFHANTGRLFHNGGFFIEESLARQASLNGTNLIFSGWGGDEFISTGDRGIETDLLRGLRLRTYFRRNPVRPLKRFIKYFLEYTLFPAVGMLHPRVARSFASDARYLKKPYRKSSRKVLRNFYFHTSRRRMHLRYLRFYHLQDRCEIWTTMGYRLGIEYRYPLLDRRIIEYMLRVPSEHLCRTSYFRPLLRIIGEGILPDDVRLNTSKKDHLFSAWWGGLVRHSGLSALDEAEGWRSSPDLGFADFDKLMEDIKKYRHNHGSVDEAALFRALVYLRAVYEFSKDFRRKGDGSGE
jgi:asparagine synthase (glutamine-hydrolysing)